MKPTVTQKHPMSCGLACVAYILDVGYGELALEQTSDKLNRVGFYCPELVAILNNAGLSYRWKKLSNSNANQNFNNGDIVFIGRTQERPGGHFLVRSPYGWMDPWENLPNNKNMSEARSSYLDRLPGNPEYVIYH